jgi:hypothetical protein
MEKLHLKMLSRTTVTRDWQWQAGEYHITVFHSSIIRLLHIDLHTQIKEIKFYLKKSFYYMPDNCLSILYIVRNCFLENKLI